MGFPVGGVEAMLLLIALSGLLLGLVGLMLTRRLGVVSAFALVGFVWSILIIGVVTLLPSTGPDVVVTNHNASCSMDIGGPAPSGFWIFGGTQRTLNTIIFVPAGALLVLGMSRWRIGWLVVPVGLLGLIAYSAAIEFTQLELARLGRACDVTDLVDNATGAVLGVGVGLLLALVFRPWRRRRRTLS